MYDSFINLRLLSLLIIHSSWCGRKYKFLYFLYSQWIKFYEMKFQSLILTFFSFLLWLECSDSNVILSICLKTRYIWKNWGWFRTLLSLIVKELIEFVIYNPSVNESNRLSEFSIRKQKDPIIDVWMKYAQEIWFIVL